MKPRLIALDIDGTLLAPRVAPDSLPDAAITEVIKAHISAGTVVVLATGRMYPGTARIARHLGIEHPLICQQGASIHALDGRLTASTPIDLALALAIAGYAHDAGLGLAWFNAERYLVTALNPAAEHFAAVSDVTAEVHSSPERSGVAPHGVDVISCVDHGPRIHRELGDRFGADAQLLDFGTVTAAYAPVATKGQSVAALAESLGIAAGASVAIGDSANDASMLSWAGLGATPEHCDSYARAAADRVLEGQGTAGVTRLLEQLL